MEFTEPVERLKKDLEEIKADKDIPEDEKKLAVEDLELEIKAAEPLKNRDNIDVVKRNFAELLKLLPDDGTDDAGSTPRRWMKTPRSAPRSTSARARSPRWWIHRCSRAAIFALWS